MRRGWRPLWRRRKQLGNYTEQLRLLPNGDAERINGNETLYMSLFVVSSFSNQNIFTECHGSDRRAAAVYRRQGAEWSELAVTAYHVLPGMTSECRFCGAMRFVDELLTICCLNGKVVLPHHHDPPEPLIRVVSSLEDVRSAKNPFLSSFFLVFFISQPAHNTLLTEQNSSGRHFRAAIRSYNSALSLASTTSIFVALPF
jgi:hypothetical protein